MRKAIYMLILVLFVRKAEAQIGPEERQTYLDYRKGAVTQEDQEALETAYRASRKFSFREICGYDKRKIRGVAVDTNNHLYAATNFGLLIAAPEPGRSKKLSWLVKFISPISKVFGFFEKLFTGNDSFALISEGSNGCVVVNGNSGLPYEKLTSVYLGENGELVLGAEKGVILLRGGRFYYFAGQRWLPDNMVTYAVIYKNNIIAKTTDGFSKILRFETTLAEKERYFSQLMDVRFKRFGFATSRQNGVPQTRDNDGLWTSMYLASQVFNCAKTKDATACQNAHESLEALLKLHRVTGKHGFFARAAVHEGETLADTFEDGKWHTSETMPGWKWKGDTSFDELVGHFFAFAIYYDLVATQEEKNEIRRTVNAVADQLLKNNLTLVDINGKPTSFGRGNPKNTFETVEGFIARGPISVSTLSALKVAHHITNRSDIKEKYEELVRNYRYALNTYNARLHNELLVKIPHSNDELIFLSYFNLIRLEQDPGLKALYLVSLERYWQKERPERNPLWNFIYGAISGNETYDHEEALQTLRELPRDLRNWKMENGHRSDVSVGTYRKVRIGDRVLSYREIGAMKWNCDPYQLDWGGNGKTEEDPGFWLLPYWMGKYYKLF